MLFTLKHAYLILFAKKRVEHRGLRSGARPARHVQLATSHSGSTWGVPARHGGTPGSLVGLFHGKCHENGWRPGGTPMTQDTSTCLSSLSTSCRRNFHHPCWAIDHFSQHHFSEGARSYHIPHCWWSYPVLYIQLSIPQGYILCTMGWPEVSLSIRRLGLSYSLHLNRKTHWKVNTAEAIWTLCCPWWIGFPEIQSHNPQYIESLSGKI